VPRNSEQGARLKAAVSMRLGPRRVARIKSIAGFLPASRGQTRSVTDSLETRLLRTQSGVGQLKRRNARLRSKVDRLQQKQQTSARRVERLHEKLKTLQGAEVASDARSSASALLMLTLLGQGKGDVSLSSPGGPLGVPGAVFHERLVHAIKDPSVARAAVEILVDIDQPLVADEVARAHGVVAALPVRYLRALSRELRARGFLLRGLPYAEEAAKTGRDRDVRTLAFRRGEVDVLSGAFQPTVQMDPVGGTPGRILHVVGFSLPHKQSGYTIRTHYTAMAQIAAGLDTHVVTQVGVREGEVARTEEVDGVPYHRMPGPMRSELALSDWLQSNTEQLAHVVERVKPAVLHAHSDFLNAICAQAVGDAAGIPVVYESRGFWEESWISRTCNEYNWPGLKEVEQAYGAPEAYTWRRDREAEARSRAAHVVTLARVMADKIRLAGIDQERISVVPNAVQTDAFPTLERDSTLATRVGLGDDEVVVGYISSLVEYEGIDTLIEAYAKIRGLSARKLRLLIVGDGAERRTLEELADSLGAEGITFTGQVPHEDVLGYYSLIDIFVVPRKPADVCRLVTPLKPFEAFSTGRAVVLSDVEALAEIAQESGAATLFSAGDPSSLSEVLGFLIDNDAVRDDLAERGAAWVRATRTWAANADAYADLYARLTR
jgi:glycosyltransferase involved in cell wall biosynthesis